jgi:CheY-like chemotaxis protein
LRLLLVEDEALIALDLEELVASLGHEVVGVADTLQSAIDTAAAHAPDAALVDLNLRDGMTGKAVARALCASFHIRVGFITGNTDQLAGDFAGAEAVVEKPFTDSGVREMLLVLEAARAGAPPPAELKYARLAAA